MSGYGHALAWARRQVDEGVLPTAVLGIADANGVLELEAFGASGPRRAAVGDHYPLFSITKPIVALTALRAVERGLLTPQTPLQDARPAFGLRRSDTVRLRHLLSHTSGIAEPPLHTPLGLEASLLGADADFAAGTVSRYSSIAFAGVQALVEHATGESLQHELDALAADAGMPGLTFDAGCDPHPVFDAAEQGLDYPALQRLAHPGAGLYATASDLLALGSALLSDGGQVVHPTTVSAMLRPQTTGLPRLEPYPAERGQDWGLGWNLRFAAPGLLEQRTYGHGGWAGTEFWIYPDLGVAFVLLTNIASPSRLGLDVDRLHNAVVAGTPAAG
ncbi:beta-lactamase family protein [Herbiconiux sp. VKM Ac-1786]|jgi:CubicO group peptidase (beta-lactamase class C family)|uniref:serine hydrolase domain-containing protein n=1 Tax=Herbiconiux sp. VKM Ac-1786 TaxID=2783824 RepID=UPI00188BBEBE|nr:serine hydrolase domain-containing protein [Herbiconiux sp. VKM Ac-1786]MBF4574268.1 beta-lactamase family protein [Herbiconiux sp. VKM Ac-1786]